MDPSIRGCICVCVYRSIYKLVSLLICTFRLKYVYMYSVCILYTRRNACMHSCIAGSWKHGCNDLCLCGSIGSVGVPVWLSICLSFLSLSTSSSICLSNCLSTYLSSYLSVCPSVCLFIDIESVFSFTYVSYLFHIYASVHPYRCMMYAWIIRWQFDDMWLFRIALNACSSLCVYVTAQTCVYVNAPLPETWLTKLLAALRRRPMLPKSTRPPEDAVAPGWARTPPSWA